MCVKKIAVDGTETDYPDIKGKPDIHWAYECLGYPNRMIERVNVLYEGKPAELLVDEEGLLYRRPVNPKATDIYRAASRARGYALDTLHEAIIVGDAILLTGRNRWK
jgi:hypothetical protein